GRRRWAWVPFLLVGGRLGSGGLAGADVALDYAGPRNQYRPATSGGPRNRYRPRSPRRPVDPAPTRGSSRARRRVVARSSRARRRVVVGSSRARWRLMAGSVRTGPALRGRGIEQWQYPAGEVGVHGDGGVGAGHARYPVDPIQHVLQ